MSKGWKITIIILVLALFTWGGIEFFAKGKLSPSAMADQNAANEQNLSDFLASEPATPITNVNQVTPLVPVQPQSYYSQQYLQSLVPSNIADSVNAFSSDQWNQIVTAANKLSGAKFSMLQTKLQGIGWLDALAINALSTQTLFNKTMSYLNSQA